MKVFQITEIQFLDPLTIIAFDGEQAVDLFMEGMIAGFGNRPDILYKMAEVKPNTATRDGKSLVYLAAGELPGIAWKGERVWELFRRFA